MCAFCIPEAFAGRVPRAVLLNSPVSLCLYQFALTSRTNETIFHSPYTLPSSVSCKSCICHSYENCRGVHQQFPFWFTPSATERNSLLITGHLHSTPFLSRRCALFCTLQNSTLFFSNDCALFAQNHPGGGYGHPTRRKRDSSHAFGIASNAGQAPPLQTRRKWRPEGRLYGKTERKNNDAEGHDVPAAARNLRYRAPTAEKGDKANQTWRERR